MVADRTGRALGTLNPVIYFINGAGHILLPPEEIGHGPVIARRLYEERYKHQGYAWCEAGTLADVQKLQKRMVEQEERELKKQAETTWEGQRSARERVNSNLRQRMASSDCDPWERDFIRYWLQNREDKQTEFMQRFQERNQYLWAAEQDSKTQVSDRMPE